nr:CRISPR-associated endonuclease Cas2 [Desulfobacter latus]
MVCYDIADPRRLGQIHRFLKKKGLGVQKSVFFIQRSEKGMVRLLDELGGIIHKKEDDIRAYPVESPQAVWTTGGILEAFPLVMPGRQTVIKQEKKKKSLWQRILGR